eukprot:1292695-Rhodomonas_salina.1
MIQARRKIGASTSYELPPGLVTQLRPYAISVPCTAQRARRPIDLRATLLRWRVARHRGIRLLENGVIGLAASPFSGNRVFYVSAENHIASAKKETWLFATLD